MIRHHSRLRAIVPARILRVFPLFRVFSQKALHSRLRVSCGISQSQYVDVSWLGRSIWGSAPGSEIAPAYEYVASPILADIQSAALLHNPTSPHLSVNVKRLASLVSNSLLVAQLTAR